MKVEPQRPIGWSGWTTIALVGVIIAKEVCKVPVVLGWIEDRSVIQTLKWVEVVLSPLVFALIIGGPVWAGAGRLTRVLSSTLFGLYLLGVVAGGLGFTGYLHKQGQTTETSVLILFVVIVGVVAISLLVALIRDWHRYTTREVQLRLRGRLAPDPETSPTKIA